MEKAVDREAIDGAMVLTDKGCIMTSWGFDSLSPKVVSAICANVWSHFQHVGKLQTLLFQAEQGHLAVANLLNTDCFVALYTRQTKDPAWLLQRLGQVVTEIANDPIARDPGGAEDELAREDKGARRLSAGSQRTSEPADDDDGDKNSNHRASVSSEQSKES